MIEEDGLKEKDILMAYESEESSKLIFLSSSTLIWSTIIASYELEIDLRIDRKILISFQKFTLVP